MVRSSYYRWVIDAYASCCIINTMQSIPDELLEVNPEKGSKEVIEERKIEYSKQVTGAGLQEI